MMSQSKIGITHDNVHDSFRDFYTKLDGSVNRHAPFKKPWLSHIIVKMIKIRNKVFARKKWQPNNENHKRLYNLLRNRVNREKND